MDRSTGLRLYRGLFLGCAVVACSLYVFQGVVYFAALDASSLGLVPPFGGLAATLMAIGETLGVFLTSALLLPALDWLARWGLPLPLLLLSGLARLVSIRSRPTTLYLSARRRVARRVRS